MEKLNNIYTQQSDVKEPDEIQRIQFMGGGSMYEMSMSKEKLFYSESGGCWIGCGLQEVFEFAAPSVEISSDTVGITWDVNVEPYHYTMDYNHDPVYYSEDGEEAAISGKMVI